MKKDIKTYEEMLEKTRKFYKRTFNYNIPKKHEQQAVTSLSMSQYAKEFKDKYKESDLKDNTALATVGDAVLSAYLMLKEYKYKSTKGELTNKKDILTNYNLKGCGKCLLKDYLFYTNTDLKDENKKDYATAFEAVVGFIALVDINKLDDFLKKYLH